MRNVRKLLLLVVGVVAAVAFVPSAASAQNVELEREQGGNCPAVVTAVNHLPSDAGCNIHAITEPGTTANLYQHEVTGERLFSQCQNEFEAAFNSAGVGFLYNQVLSEDANCGREPCDEVEPSHRNLVWPARISEPTGTPGASQERISVRFCLYTHSGLAATEGAATGIPCTVHLAVNQGPDHSYEVRTLPIDPPPGPPSRHGTPCEEAPTIELVGHWITTPSTPRHRGFRVHHLDG